MKGTVAVSVPECYMLLQNFPFVPAFEVCQIHAILWIFEKLTDATSRDASRL